MRNSPGRIFYWKLYSLNGRVVVNIDFKFNEPIAKVKTKADEGDYEIQTSLKAAGIPSAVC
jgi:hypothetical protein